jgi:hypothetical protein
MAVSRTASPASGGGQIGNEQLQSSGVIRTMAPTQSPAPPSKPGPPAHRNGKAVAEAEKTYQALKKQAEPDDLTPEIYLISVYSEHGQYDKMVRIIDIMLAQRPHDANLQKLKAWASSQAAGTE